MLKLNKIEDFEFSIIVERFDAFVSSCNNEGGTNILVM